MYILSILLLLTIVGWESWQNLLIVIGAIAVLLLVKSERLMILLASFLFLLLPITYWFDKEMVVYLGNAIYVLLAYYVFFKLIGPGEFSIDIKWDKYINYLYVFVLLVVLGFSGASLIVFINSGDRQSVESIDLEDGLDIHIDTGGAISEDIDFSVYNYDDEETNILISIKKPDEKWVTFESELKTGINELTIYKEVVDQTGNYEILVTVKEESVRQYLEVVQN